MGAARQMGHASTPVETLTHEEMEAALQHAAQVEAELARNPVEFVHAGGSPDEDEQEEEEAANPAVKELLAKMAEMQRQLEEMRAERGETVKSSLVPVSEVAEWEEERKLQRILREVSKRDNMVNILIHPADGPGGHEPVFVGLNGHTMLLPRNQQVKVSKGILEVLYRAKIVGTYPETGTDGQMRMVPVVQQRYALTILDFGLNEQTERIAVA